MKEKCGDPLGNPAFKSPGLMDMLGEILLGKKRRLECLQIEITSHCMGACIYCPHTTHADKWKPRHMEADTFARLWSLLRMSGRAHLQGWGEPLLHPRFIDFAALARKAGCSVSTTTCGLVMNDQIANQIVATGLDLVAFSLAGTDEASNSARMKVPFEKVCQSIAVLDRARSQDSDLAIHLAYLLLADNLESVKKLPELMEKLNVDAAVISTLDFIAVPEHASLAFAPHDRDKIHKAEEALLAVRENSERMGRQIFFSLPSDQIAAHAGGCRENVMHTLYVNTEGDISPCVYLNVQGHENGAKCYGNVNEESAVNIWDKLDYMQFRNRLAAGHPDSQCRICPKRFEQIY